MSSDATVLSFVGASVVIPPDMANLRYQLAVYVVSAPLDISGNIVSTCC